MTDDGVEYRYVRVFDQGYTKNNFSNIKEINDLLEKGWIPVRECPFGSSCSSASNILVLLKRNIKKADITLTEVFGDELDEQNEKEATQQETSPVVHNEEQNLPEFSGFS